MSSKIDLPLWKHQEHGASRGADEGNLAVLFEIGTGKSRTAIEILRRLCSREKRLLRTLIVSPKITLTNWKREICEYSKIHPMDVHVLVGPGAKRFKTFIEQVQHEDRLSKPKVFITNYEGLMMLKLFDAIKEWAPEVIIGDEIHRIKNPKSKRGKKLLELRDNARFAYGLTGTPILNSPMDVFNIYKFIDKGETFGTNFFKFRSHWFVDDNAAWAGNQGYYPKFVPREELYADFSAKINKKSVKALKAECLDLPPFIRQEITVELSPEQKKLYDEMKRDYVAYIDQLEQSGEPLTVVANLAITKALRLQQIITGYAKTETGEIYKIKSNPRLEALREFLEDHAENHKIIVWSVFHENYEDIANTCKKLNLGYAELHGKVNQKERDNNIDRFNNDEDCRVLIANQAAGGIGINLVSSSIAVFYSKNFSYEQDIQAEGRNYRGGSHIHDKVTRYDIVAEGTIDEVINEALKNKKDLAETILQWGRK